MNRLYICGYIKGEYQPAHLYVQQIKNGAIPKCVLPTEWGFYSPTSEIILLK